MYDFFLLLSMKMKLVCILYLLNGVTKIKKMSVGKRGNTCGFVLDAVANKPSLVPFLQLYLHFSSGVLRILVFHSVAFFLFLSLCFSFLTVFHIWSFD